MIRIALANPRAPEGLTRTILDGVQALQEGGAPLEIRLAGPLDYPLKTTGLILGEEQFTRYARTADLVLLPYCKRGMQGALVERIGAWEKTVYLDGSEPGKNRRLDPAIRPALLDGSYAGTGGVDREMLAKCALYFRRERPYLPGTLPLPFGIERRYTRYVRAGRARDIDVVCLFGQEAYPPLRRQVREALEVFCNECGLRCLTTKTWTTNGFYRALARAKVGVSVSGGGFDSFRFWETLGADCLLLTETIDIDPPPGTTLAYERVRQFGDLDSFKTELARLATFLQDGYDAWDRRPEYERILAEHSTAARVRYLLREAATKGLINASI